MKHYILYLIDGAIPEPLRPTIFNVAVTTANIEFGIKMFSLGLSAAYLIWKWYIQVQDRKKNKIFND